VLTDRWLARNFKSGSDTPLEHCREVTSDDVERKATSVSVSDVSVDGSSAAATAEATGDERYLAGAYGSCSDEFRLMMFSAGAIGSNTGDSPEQVLQAHSRRPGTQR
jgi:hypothetical protein